MNKPTQTWTEQIQAHLDLLIQVCSRLPANERLEVESLNKILISFEEAKSLFLFQLDLQGFISNIIEMKRRKRDS